MFLYFDFAPLRVLLVMLPRMFPVRYVAFLAVEEKEDAWTLKCRNGSISVSAVILPIPSIGQYFIYPVRIDENAILRSMALCS